jgi:hypothetical protein
LFRIAQDLFQIGRLIAEICDAQLRRRTDLLQRSGNLMQQVGHLVRRVGDLLRKSEQGEAMVRGLVR